jgi:hypothetical protein
VASRAASVADWPQGAGTRLVLAAVAPLRRVCSGSRRVHAGAAYGGVGIPQVIQSGQEAALRAVGQSTKKINK